MFYPVWSFRSFITFGNEILSNRNVNLSSLPTGLFFPYRLERWVHKSKINSKGIIQCAVISFRQNWEWTFVLHTNANVNVCGKEDKESLTITQKTGRGSQFIFACTNYTICRSDTIKIKLKSERLFLPLFSIHKAETPNVRWYLLCTLFLSLHNSLFYKVKKLMLSPQKLKMGKRF